MSETLEPLAAEPFPHRNGGITVPVGKIAVNAERRPAPHGEKPGERTIVAEHLFFSIPFPETEDQIKLILSPCGKRKRERETELFLCIRRDRNGTRTGTGFQPSVKRGTFGVRQRNGNGFRRCQAHGQRRSLRNIRFSIAGAKHRGNLFHASGSSAQKYRVWRKRQTEQSVFSGPDRMFRLHQIEQFKSGRRTEKKIRCGRLSEIDLFHARPQNCDRAFLFVLK